MIKLFLIFSLISSNIFSSEMPLQSRELANKEMKSQNKHIVKLACAEMSKSLPKTIDKYTKLTTIQANEVTIEYIFEIDTGPKSDEAIKRDDHTRMREAVTIGTCKSSKRFLDADISLSYIYKNIKTKTELFRFDINKESCFKL